jgi:hypothetical protein
MSGRWCERAALVVLLCVVACATQPPTTRARASIVADDDTLPFTIEQQRGRTVPVRRPDASAGYDERLRELDPAAARRVAANDGERRLADALALVLAGSETPAERLLDSLCRTSTNGFVRRTSRSLLTGLLHVAHHWPALRALPADSESPPDRADVRRWAEAFRGAPEPGERYTRDSVAFPLVLSPIGVPMMPVELNGHRFLFWLDTGASTTMIAGDVAAAAGVTAWSGDSLEVVTVLGRVPASAAVIPRLRVGPLLVSASPGMIVRSGAFEVRQSLLGAAIQPLKIDGIIGWDVIRKLDIRIDHPGGALFLRTPRRARASGRDRDLMWLGYPLVRFVGSDGEGVVFGLDTGLEESFVAPSLARRLGIPVRSVERRHVGAIGADTIVHVNVLSGVSLNLGRETLMLRHVMVGAPVAGTWISLDGVLGADVGRRGVVRIDASNGLFRVSAR